MFINIGMEVECQWFSTKLIFAPQGHFSMSGDIFRFHNWGGATGILWVEVRGAAKHATGRTASWGKELSSPKCECVY